MDIMTLCGLSIGGLILLGSLFYCGLPIQQLIQPDALLIVFGGTLTATMIQCSWQDMRFGLMGLSGVLRNDLPDQSVLIDLISDAASYIRMKGYLALQPLVHDIDIPLVQQGLQMLIDNQPLELIHQKLMTEVDSTYHIESQQSQVFEVAGGVAPTMGILGAIVGLIHISGLLSSPEKLGLALAGAFSATLCGVGLANLFLLPIAGKLRQRAKQHWLLNQMILSGIVAIAQEDHPTVVREKLQAFLPGHLRLESTDGSYLDDDAFLAIPSGAH